MKTILKLVTAILLALFAGLFFGTALNINPCIVIAVLFIAGLLPREAGITTADITTGYAGEVYENILAKVSIGNEVMQNKLMKMVEPENLLSKYYIPRIKISGTILQERKETPNHEEKNQGDVAFDEKVLDTLDFMVYLTFNPRVFENYWKPYQSSSELVFSELDPVIQAKILDVLHDQVATEIGSHLLTGVKGTAADGEYFDGIVTRARNSADIIEINSAVKLTADNILDVYSAIKKALPEVIRSRGDLRMLCSYTAYDLYDDAVTAAKQNVSYDQEFTRKYKGIPLVPMSGMPENTIICTYCSLGEASNLWGGITYADINEPVLINRVENASERYFIKMLMKADTNIAWDEHAVLYDYVATTK